MERLDAHALAYCQMGDHYHLVLHTRQGDLSRLIRHLNGVYARAYNRRHNVVGHLFQGRFKAILVDRDAYLLTLLTLIAGGFTCRVCSAYRADFRELDFTAVT